MTSSFPSSRLNNLREKKSSNYQNQQGTSDLRLTLISETQKSSYQPTATFSNTRTSMRLLKGRIQKTQSTQKNEMVPIVPSQNNKTPSEQISNDLKLVLHDSPQIQTKKNIIQSVVKPPLKRILIAKELPKQQPVQQKIQTKITQPLPPSKQEQVPQKIQINQQEVQESKQPNQNENDLVECPEGCGRKFNRKALEKHAKACKLVFMSKRKQFNSQVKRIVSKEQATMIRQNKIRQKSQLGKTKSKGFEKTGENWKAASEEFRAALKAIKKQQSEQGVEKVQKMVNCKYCQKLFNEVFLQQHTQNCAKKKQQQKKVTKKKK